MSLEHWQDELQLERLIEEIAEEKGLDEDFVADHLEDFFSKELTYNQENDILEHGIEQWRENKGDIL